QHRVQLNHLPVRQRRRTPRGELARQRGEPTGPILLLPLEHRRPTHPENLSDLFRGHAILKELDRPQTLLVSGPAALLRHDFRISGNAPQVQIIMNYLVYDMNTLGAASIPITRSVTS